MDQIKLLEKKLGISLPQAYRDFLRTHNDSILDEALIFKPPRSGIIDELLTIEQILENDKNEQIGIPDKGLMCIGSNLMGGYLYLKVTDNGFGEIHYMESYNFKEVFPSFSLFLEETEKEET